MRALRTQRRLSAAQLSDRYGIECKPVRDLLVGYLRERQAALDCATLRGIAHTLGKLFWQDLEVPNPGIASLAARRGGDSVARTPACQDIQTNAPHEGT